MSTIPTNRAPMLPEQVVDELTYRCYSYNRRRSPHVGPEKYTACGWRDVPEMEARLQAEIAIEKARA